jgi:hypothetical protein
VPNLLSSAPWTKADNDQAHALSAAQNQTDAAKWLLPILAVGGTAGALSGMYNARKKQKQITDLQEDLDYPNTAVPLGKSASLGDVGNFLAGGNAHSGGPMAVPWFPAAAVASLYGGSYLGKKLVNNVTDKNIEGDTEEELNKAKQRYLQAVRPPASTGVTGITEPVAAKAANYEPPFFSMDNLGPSMGVGGGLLGGAALLSAIHGYSKTKQKTKEDQAREKQQALTESLKAFQPVAPAKLNQPVLFS